MQIKKDAERAKAAADPFATPGSARATLTAHRNKVKEDKSVKNKVYKEATVAYFHGTNAHFKHALIEGLGVGKVAAPQCSRAQTDVQRPALQHCTAPVDIAYAADTPARWSAG